MKVIDLLNKISNDEEVPKKIRYFGDTFEYAEKEFDYYCFESHLYLGDYSNKWLNDEVEIIEEYDDDSDYEEETIKQIILGVDNDSHETYIINNKIKYSISIPNEIIIDKLNEVIGVINKLNEKE